VTVAGFGQGRLAAAAVLAATAVIGAEAWAQAGPFGVGRPPAPVQPAPADGVTGWLLAQQAQFYRQLAALIRAAKADGSAVVLLLGVSFLYGVFHAAGPGHGKAVISSYLVANNETWRRGIVLSFASALLQAMTAIALVGVAAVLIGTTARTMGSAVRIIELASYALIAAIGARLLWVKGLALLAALRAAAPQPIAIPSPASVPPGGTHAPHHDHAAHDCGPGCGHAHGPVPAELAGRGGWQRGLAAIVAVGLRPCSGAILVLVFALAQGLFWAGVASTLLMSIGTALTVAAIATLAVGARGLAGRLAQARPGGGTIAVRGLEVLASALVLAFGLMLLTGYLANERLFGL
jgi:ABC-type nickel/cobalt efflux system permease component RcnA